MYRIWSRVKGREVLYVILTYIGKVYYLKIIKQAGNGVVLLFIGTVPVGPTG